MTPGRDTAPGFFVALRDCTMRERRQSRAAVSDRSARSGARPLVGSRSIVFYCSPRMSERLLYGAPALCTRSIVFFIVVYNGGAVECTWSALLE
jgi:hypothetical protein